MLVRLAVLASVSLALAGCATTPEPAPATPPPGPSSPPPVAATKPPEVGDAALALLEKGRTSVELADGRVLSAGGDEEMAGTDAAQVFDPKARRWTPVGAMSTARVHHALAPLDGGKALVCGGEDTKKGPTAIPVPGKVLASCEVFDPATGKFTAAAPMHAPRKRLTLTRLGDGRVLAVGDPGSEVYDPKTNAWGSAVATAVPYLAHTATLLADGRVLVVGAGGQPYRGSAETFDPKEGKWTRAPQPQQALMDHTATLLPDGSVLIVGGVVAQNGGLPYPVAFATVYEPKHERWNLTGQPHAPHWKHAAVLLPNGDVVVAGGAKNDPEIYAREVWKDLPPELAVRLSLIRPSERTAGSSSGPGR